MGLLSYLVSQTRYGATYAPWDDFWFQKDPRGTSTASGANVTSASAMRLGAVFGSIGLISTIIGSLPLILFRKTDAGTRDEGRERAITHPSYNLYRRRPNAWQSASEWLTMGVQYLLTRGNFYNRIDLDNRGAIRALTPLHPDRMTVEQNEATGRIGYIYRPLKGQQRTFTQDEIAHTRSHFTLDNGITGASVIEFARESIGAAQMQEGHAAKFWAGGGELTGVLTVPGTLNESTDKAMQASWKESRRTNSIAILQGGTTFTPLSVKGRDAQYIECVAPGTLFTMADGCRKRVEDLRVGDEVMSWDGEALVAAKVSALGTPPVKPLVRIRTARGRELIASADHPVLTLHQMRTLGGRPALRRDEWRAMGDLRVGQYVRVALGSVDEGHGLSFDEAYFLGAMAGDGYVRTGVCSFSNTDAAVIGRMALIVSSLGGRLKPSPGRASDFHILTGGIGRGGSRIRRLLNHSGMVGRHSHDKSVPEIVVTGGREAWCGFLSGYFDTDGSVVNRAQRAGRQAYWSSTSTDLLDGCQHLLALLGIQGSIHRLSVGGMRRVLGHLSMARPTYGLFVTASLGALGGALDLAHPGKRQRLEEYVTAPASRYRSVNIEYDRIAWVGSVGEGETIGVEIGGTHTHVTGGLITHNSRAFSVTDICRFFNISPYWLGVEGQWATGTGIESRMTELVRVTLQPWITALQQSLWRDTIEDDNLYVEFLIEELQKADSSNRYQNYAIGIMNGFLAENEARVRENLNPSPGLWTPRRSANQDRGGDPRVRPQVPGPPERRNRMEEDDEEDAEGRARRIAYAAAVRLVRKETEAIRKWSPRFAADSDGWRKWVAEFYERYAGDLESTLAMSAGAARGYCNGHRAALLAVGVRIAEEWEREQAPLLVEIALMAPREERADA